MLYHRYRLDDAGLIRDAKIVPPTSQNLASIEDDLMCLAPRMIAMTASDATRLAEQAVRNYDPCISCATHFLKVTLEGGVGQSWPRASSLWDRNGPATTASV